MENRKTFYGVKSLRSDSEADLKVFSVPSFMTVAYEYVFFIKEMSSILLVCTLNCVV